MYQFLDLKHLQTFFLFQNVDMHSFYVNSICLCMNVRLPPWLRGSREQDSGLRYSVSQLPGGCVCGRSSTSAGALGCVKMGAGLMYGQSFSPNAYDPNYLIRSTIFTGTLSLTKVHI